MDINHKKLSPQECLPDQQSEEDNIRMQYAGAIRLLCDLSVQITDAEDQQVLDRCVQDWCEITGWNMQRKIDRVEISPPKPK